MAPEQSLGPFMTASSRLHRQCGAGEITVRMIAQIITLVSKENVVMCE
jgi:hypothetical protein